MVTGVDDTRLDELTDWLRAKLGNTIRGLQPASTDASFRRYFRVFADGGPFIAMDAPPARERCEPFVRIAGYLQTMGLNGPRVIATDLERGYLLLSDLGERQYLDELQAAPARADELYAAAIDALLRLQQQGARYLPQLPSYDAALLQTELSLFEEWLCGRHLDITFNADEQRRWQDCCAWLIEQALGQPPVFVHRDYHARNLMVCADNNPGILDFQDAVAGPLTYDLVSLLKDCYVRWPADWVSELALQQARSARKRQLHSLSDRDYLHAFDTMGVQRHLKAAGIFARLSHRDGKSGYLADVPRTLSYIVELAPHHQELDFLATLLVERCLPALAAT